MELLASFERGADEVTTLSAVRGAFALDKNPCVTVLPQGGYQFFQTEAPDVAKADMKEAVRWKIKDMIDFPPDQASLDVLEVPATGAQGRAKSIYVAACKNDVVASLMRQFFDAKVDLQVIDIAEMAQRNIAALSETEGRGLAFLALDEAGGILTFTAQGELCMVRRVEVGSRQLESADPSRLEQLLERIGLELQRSLDNFDRQFSAIPIQKLLIAPGAKSQSLQTFLADYLGMPVDVLSLADVLDISAIPGLENPVRQAQCLTTIGAALRGSAA
ncbi:MAG: agglutinin biogenesis protein MshI [Rhodocyclaceae bacterium]|nr:MAG: agglutinin biogenesis protein MshI [Rhodocyclaceae bacterium]